MLNFEKKNQIEENFLRKTKLTGRQDLARIAGSFI